MFRVKISQIIRWRRKISTSFFPAVFPAALRFFPLAPFLSGQGEGKSWEEEVLFVILQRLPKWEMRSLVSLACLWRIFAGGCRQDSTLYIILT